MIPLSLYIHIPWCVEKCPYCDFNSHKKTGDLPVDDFITALFNDLESELPFFWGRTVQSVFIGGGTPSILSPDSINKILDGVRARLPMAPRAEITMEANPGSVEHGLFKDYAQAGVNRCSLGIQSLNDDHLKKLGRIHTAIEALSAIESVSKAGFNSFNIDLMFALPEQTIEQALQDLKWVKKFDIPHVSWYQLTIEPNTVFYNHPPTQPEDDAMAEMQQQGLAFLRDIGIEQYEVSAYAKPGQQCLHNTNYWQFGDYIGIGPGAHGKRTCHATQRVLRRAKKRQPDSYITYYLAEGKTPDESQWNAVDSEDLPFEFMLNAMRLKSGVDASIFQTNTYLPFPKIEKALTDLESHGLIQSNWQKHIQTTEKGFAFLNEVTSAFLPE